MVPAKDADDREACASCLGKKIRIDDEPVRDYLRNVVR